MSLPAACKAVSAMGVGDVKELVGARTAFGADHALFVSWGGFTAPARQMARNEWFNLRLWDADDLVEEVTAVYDRLDPAIRTRLPLEQVWLAADTSGLSQG